MPERLAPSRSLTVLLALVGMSMAGSRYVTVRALQIAAPAASPATPAVVATDILNKYCVPCHNGRLKVDSLDVNHVADNVQQWEKIVSKLRTGEMPPPGRPRPDAATYTAVAAALEKDL